MARAHFSLKSTHLIMWSSPILLVVLVFTLTSAAPPNDPAASSHRPSSKSAATTTTSTPTTTSTSTTTTTAATKPPSHRSPSTTLVTTTPQVALSSSVVTTTTVRRTNAAPNASAMNAGSSGELAPGFEVVDVPLRGPGSWTFSASASTSQSLQCGAQTSPVFQQVVVGATQSCQLVISSTSSKASLTWQLTRVT